MENLSVAFRSPRGVVEAVRGVSFSLAARESLAIVGESGSGKSVTCLSIIGLVETRGAEIDGSIIFEGTELCHADESTLAKIRGSKIAYVAQDPSRGLNPYLTIRAHMQAVLSHHGVPPGQHYERATALLSDVGLHETERVLLAYPGELSGGMAQRVMLALALAPNPQVLIADEPTTALDVTTQVTLLALLRELGARHGLALIVVSHNVGVVRSLCSKTVVLYGGSVMEQGTTASLLSKPDHPYTRALLESVPSPERRHDDARPVPGDPPGAFDTIGGCPFHPRCLVAIEICRTVTPPLHPTPGGGQAACHLVGHDEPVSAQTIPGESGRSGQPRSGDG